MSTLSGTMAVDKVGLEAVAKNSEHSIRQQKEEQSFQGHEDKQSLYKKHKRWPRSKLLTEKQKISFQIVGKDSGRPPTRRPERS